MIWNSRRSGAGRADSWFNLNRPPVSPAPFSSSPQRSGASPRPENAQLGTGMTEQAPTPTTTYVSGGPYTTGQEHIGVGGPVGAGAPSEQEILARKAQAQGGMDTWPRNENTTPAPPTAPTPGQIAGQPAPATVAPTPTPPAAPQSTPATPPMTGSIDGGGNTSYTDQYGYPVDTTTGQPFPMNEQQLVTFFQQKVQNGSPFSAIDALRVRQWLPGAQGDALANAVLRAAAGFPFEYTMTPPPPPPPTGNRPPPITRPTTPAEPRPTIMHRGQPQQSTPPVTTPGYRSVYDRQPISDLGAAANGVAGAMQGLPPVPEFRYPTVQRARPGGIFIR